MYIRLLLVPTFVFLLATPILAEEEEVLERSRAYQVIEKLTAKFQADLEKIAKSGTRMTVAQYRRSDRFPGSMRDYTLHRMEAAVRQEKNAKLNLVRCIGCFNPRAISDGKDIYIRKGFIDSGELKDTLRRLKVDSYLSVNLTNSDDEVIMQVSVNNAKDLSQQYQAEYRGNVQGPERTGFVMGIAGQSIIFHDSKLPGLMGGRLTLAQRLVGLGDIGLGLTAVEAEEVCCEPIEDK